MTFEQDYNKILQYAKSKVARYNLNIDASDLVNDAYLKLHDKPYFIKNYRNEIKNLSLIEKHNVPSNISYGQRGTTHGRFTGHHCCVKCKDVKSASEFYIEKRISGRAYLSTVCKPCHIKRVAELRVKNPEKYKPIIKKSAQKQWKKNKNNKEFRKKQDERVRKYIDTNRSDWNDYNRGRYERDKENLTDAYVRKLIRHKFKGVEITAETVRLEREKILRKRLEKERNMSYFSIDNGTT